jgi:hypothetical protein
VKALLLAALCGACVFTGARSQYAPKARPGGATVVPGTDALLADVPDGADVLVELDLGRLYANPTVGAVAKRALAAPAADVTLPGFIVPQGAAPLARATMVVMAAYAVGTHDAATVTIIATKGEVPNGVAIADGVVALGPPELVARVKDAAAGRTGAITGDHAMMVTRARAMPDGAPGATLRATARLGMDARVALQPLIGADLAPASLSLWADVADDAALVAIVDGHDDAGGGGQRLYVALERMRVALAGSTSLLQLGLAPVIREATFVRSGDVVKVVATIGPKRLNELVAKLYPPGS